MSVTKEYKVGSVSNILANSCDAAALDPVLCGIFGSNKYKVQSDNSNAADGKGKKNKVQKIVKIASKASKKKQTEDSLLEQSKRKIKKTNSDVKEEGSVPKKKKKKIVEPVIHEGVSLKKKKRAKMNAEDKKPKQFDEDNDRIIQDFEREHKNDTDVDESDDDNEEGKEAAESAEDMAKKLGNYELNTPKEKNAEHESRTVFVGNLPTNIKKKYLKKLFGQFGKTETVRIRGGHGEKYFQLKKVAINKKKLNPNQASLLAYIRFATREEAEKAAEELNGRDINKHHIVVDLADNSKRDNKRAVFLGNIPLVIGDDEVRKYFQDCGKIHSVRIIRNTVTGLSKGFGYVNFQEQESVALALKKNGQDFQGRLIRVSKAIKKEKKPKAMTDADRRKLGHLKKAERMSHESANKDSLDQRPQSKSANAIRRLEQKKKQQQAAAASLEVEVKFTGDKRADRQKKIKTKPNKGELKKARIASQLTGVSTTQFKKMNLLKKQSSQKNKF